MRSRSDHPRDTTGVRLPRAGGIAASLASAAAAVLLGAWLAISAFHPFTPTMPQLALDASWVAALGEAADRGLRWGADVAFTYGPASTLVTGYFNAATLPVTLPLLLATCLSFGACTALLVGSARPAGRAGAMAAVGTVAAFSKDHPDSVLLVLPILPFLLLLSRDRPGPGRLGLAAVTALAVGALGMAKTSFPVAALPLFLLGDAAAALRRRPPVLTLPCLLGFLSADVIYGQSPADLPILVRQQWEVVAGYSEAMAVAGGCGELVAFLVASAMLVGLALDGEWRAPPRSRFRFALPFGLAWVLLILFKAGFVRQDTHTLISWYGLALIAALVAPARLRAARPRTAGAVAGMAVAGAALLGLSIAGPAAAPTGRWSIAVAAARDLLVTGPAAQVAAALDLARDPFAFARARRADRARSWRDIAAFAPLPRLDGGVDVIPSLQSRVLASGLDFRPRPSFQEYSTYTPALIAANRAFLAGPHAPDWVLFGPETALGQMTVDGRYPNLAEGALWPDLMQLYRPERRIGDLVALRRRTVPAPLAFGAPRRSEVGFGDEVAVGPVSGVPGVRAVLAAVDVRPTLLGRAAAFLFRPPLLTMDVRFADGHEQTYRFVSGLGSSGFVLSPCVSNASEFEGLADGVPPPPARVVTGFSLRAPPHAGVLLSPSIAVELRPVSGGEARSVAVPVSAWASLAAAEGLGPAATDLAVGPPSLVSLSVAGLPRVALGFGLALADDAPAREGTLCFAMHPADGTGRTLWRRCLDRARTADRAPQSVSLAVPDGTAELVLELTCESGCDDGVQGYWAPPP